MNRSDDALHLTVRCTNHSPWTELLPKQVQPEIQGQRKFREYPETKTGVEKKYNYIYLQKLELNMHTIEGHSQYWFQSNNSYIHDFNSIAKALAITVYSGLSFNLMNYSQCTGMYHITH